jgi:hypothetical protein
VQVLVSLCVVALGVTSAMVLDQVDEDLPHRYIESTLAAAEIVHISADVMRYRTTVIRGLEAPTEEAFARLTAPLPAQRARIESAADHLVGKSQGADRDGIAASEEVRALRTSLDAYFAAADEAIRLMRRVWAAGSLHEAGELRHRAELHAADNAGPKLIQVSLALDRLMERVAHEAGEGQRRRAASVQGTAASLVVGGLALAALNLWGGSPRRSRQTVGHATIAPPSHPVAACEKFATGAAAEGRPRIDQRRVDIAPSSDVS